MIEWLVTSSGAVFAGKFLLEAVHEAVKWNIGEEILGGGTKLVEWIKEKRKALEKALTNSIDDVANNNPEFGKFKSEFETLKKNLKKEKKINNNVFKHRIQKHEFCELLREAGIPHEHIEKIHELVQKRFVHHFIRLVSSHDIADAVEILFEESQEIKEGIRGNRQIIDSIYEMLKERCEGNNELISKIKDSHNILLEKLKEIKTILDKVEQKVEAIEAKMPEKLTISKKFKDIKTILTFTERIDSNVRRIIRAANLLPQEELAERLFDFFDSQLKKNNMDIKDSLEELESFNFPERYLIDSINPDLLIYIEKDFNKLIFKYNNSQLPVEKPELLWDCHCEVTRGGSFKPKDRPKNAKDLPCPIHDDKLGMGNEIASKFGSGLVQIEYDEIKVLWHNSKEFWPPSIDTIRMYENLKTDDVMNKYIHSVLDIGSGTGFLGISIAKHNPNVQELYLSDWLLTPTVFSRINWEINKGNKAHVSCKPRIGLQWNWLNHTLPPEKIDICVCNPPYLPDLEKFPEIRMNHAVGGVDLLKFIIKNGHQIAREIYLNFSNIADKEAFSVAGEANAKLIKIGESYRVPFRVRQALENENYMRDLITERRLEISEEGRYKYWHTLSTYKVTYQS